MKTALFLCFTIALASGVLGCRPDAPYGQNTMAPMDAYGYDEFASSAQTRTDQNTAVQGTQSNSSRIPSAGDGNQTDGRSTSSSANNSSGSGSDAPTH